MAAVIDGLTNLRIYEFLPEKFVNAIRQFVNS